MGANESTAIQSRPTRPGGSHARRGMVSLISRRDVRSLTVSSVPPAEDGQAFPTPSAVCRLVKVTATTAFGPASNTKAFEASSVVVANQLSLTGNACGLEDVPIGVSAEGNQWIDQRNPASPVEPKAMPPKSWLTMANQALSGVGSERIAKVAQAPGPLGPAVGPPGGVGTLGRTTRTKLADRRTSSHDRPRSGLRSRS